MSERAPDAIWNGQPVFRCRVCGDRYERVANLAAVLQHEAEKHGPKVRPSPILGASGETVMVVEAQVEGLEDPAEPANGGRNDG